MSNRLWAFSIFAVTVAVYARSAFFGWIVEWDDGGNFVNNPLLSLADPQWILVTAINGHWVPLTWLTHIAEFRLWGLEPGPWHAANVLLHALNAALLYILAVRLLGGGRHPGETTSVHLTSARIGAGTAALVWALHPLRVEAVAWVTERRLLLAGAFLLLATLAWLRGRRVTCLLLYFAAIMSHPIGVMLPWALGVLTWYQRRDERDSLPAWYASLDPVYRYSPLVPMFVTGAASSVVLVLAHHNIENALSLTQAPMLSRVWQTAYSMVFYLGNTILPVRLSPLIEYTFVPAVGQIQYPIALVACLALAWLCLRTWRQWPAFTACVAAYVVFTLPQAGLAPNGPQLVANRYSYLAALPLSILIAGAVTLAWRRRPRLTLLASGGAVVFFVVVTSFYLPVWRNGDALWTYAAEHEPTCTFCQDLASAWAYRRGDYTTAIRYMHQGLVVSDQTIYPRWERRWNLAVLRYAQGDRAGAADELRAFIAAVPPEYRWVQPHHDRLVGAQKDLAMLVGAPPPERSR